MVSKAILSESPLVDSVAEGRIPTEYTAVLDSAWARLFRRNIRIALGPDEVGSPQ
jgi:hypothetical protein